MTGQPRIPSLPIRQNPASVHLSITEAAMRGGRVLDDVLAGPLSFASDLPDLLAQAGRDMGSYVMRVKQRVQQHVVGVGLGLAMWKAMADSVRKAIALIAPDPREP